MRRSPRSHVLTKVKDGARQILVELRWHVRLSGEGVFQTASQPVIGVRLALEHQELVEEGIVVHVLLRTNKRTTYYIRLYSLIKYGPL